jgi:hypothetical protein
MKYILIAFLTTVATIAVVAVLVRRELPSNIKNRQDKRN